MSLPSLLRAYGIAPRAVVHLGAHHGEELSSYQECGFERIVLVEANPAAFAVLARKVEGTGAQAVPVAVWDHVGEVSLNLTRHETQSSLLPPAPGIEAVGQVRVPCAPLTDVLARVGLDEVSLLVLDLQGAELPVLRAAAEVVRQVPLLITEVNDEPRYHGCALASEVDEFLSSLGFVMLHRTGPFPECPGGDAIYLSARCRGAYF